MNNVLISSGPEEKWHGMTQDYTPKLYSSLLFQPVGKNKFVPFHRAGWKSSLACPFSEDWLGIPGRLLADMDQNCPREAC